MQLPFKKYKTRSTCMVYLQSFADIIFFIECFTAPSFYDWKNYSTDYIIYWVHVTNTLIFVRLHYEVKMWSKADSKRVGLKDAH